MEEQKLVLYICTSSSKFSPDFIGTIMIQSLNKSDRNATFCAVKLDNVHNTLHPIDSEMTQWKRLCATVSKRSYP